MKKKKKNSKTSKKNLQNPLTNRGVCAIIVSEREVKIMKKETIKRATKKEGEELQEYLKIMSKHNVVPAKKGKGAKYKREQKGKRGEW